MKLITTQDLNERTEGILALIYGPTGVGKTVSTLKSIPESILYLQPEPREIKRVLKILNRPKLNITIGQYTNWEQLIAFMADLAGKETDYRSIFIDSLSHLMNISILGELIDESWDARMEKKEKNIPKPLIEQTRGSQEIYGALARHMFRLCNLLMRLSSEYGKIVICSALEESTPKWNRALAAAPHFGGQQFSRNFPGFFDLIGIVETKTNKEGNVIYPPAVRFDSPNDDFMAKASGDVAHYGPLDWYKILKIKEK